MSHLKRQKIPKNWPIPRKGTKYIVRPIFGLRKGIPLLLVLRDILKIAKNRKEVKKALHEKKISLNNKICKDEKEGVQLFDKIELISSKKYYVLTLSEKGKFTIEEINEKKATQKIAKIVNKKILKGKKIQLNLSDGRNFISNEKCNINDSVIIDFKEKKIKKCLPLKKDANAFVIAGKHAGKKGKLSELKPERKMVELEMEKEKRNILIKHIIITE